MASKYEILFSFKRKKDEKKFKESIRKEEV